MKKPGQQEVEYKEKSGTAWSHAYLNQKPWHPLSYSNQRRKWIAEQQTAQKARKAEEVAHEFAQQQEFFRQTAEMSKREKEKVENLQAVGFMYMRPPGYNAESARAAEIADERKMLGLDAPPPPPPSSSQDATLVVASQGEAGGAEPEVKKKRRVKDVFGRNVATEEEFAVLKDAPKLDTGVAGRVKPFAVEIRNVKCAKCGGFGHQSGDRECPMKDVITPMEMERLKRNDPLNAIIAQATGDEPFKWELKNQPGAMSPARGGFRPDDPNQQILADEDIYDEYGGFLAGVGDGDGSDEDGKISMPDILASLTKEQRKELAALRVDEKKWKKDDRRKNKRKKKKKRKPRSGESSDEDKKKKRKPRSDESTDEDKKKKRKPRSDESSDEDKKKKRKPRSDESSDDDKKKKRKPRSDESSDEDKKKRRKPRSDESSDEDKKKRRKPRSDESSDEEQHRHRHRSSHTKPKKHRKHQNGTSSESDRVGTASEPSKKSENDSRHRHRSRDHDRERQVARDEALDEVYDSFKRQRRRDHRERRYDDLP